MSTTKTKEKTLAQIAYETFSGSFQIDSQGNHKGGTMQSGPVPWAKLKDRDQKRWQQVALAVKLAMRPTSAPIAPQDRLVVCGCGARFIASDKHVCAS